MRGRHRSGGVKLCHYFLSLSRGVRRGRGSGSVHLTWSLSAHRCKIGNSGRATSPTSQCSASRWDTNYTTSSRGDGLTTRNSFNLKRLHPSINYFISRTNLRVFFLASASLSPCHKTLEENSLFLPEPGTVEYPPSRKALLFDETIENWVSLLCPVKLS